MDLLIEDVALPSGIRTDLAIHDARFVDPPLLTRPRVIHASGLIALPGLVDLHTHLREPSGPSPDGCDDRAGAARNGSRVAETIATGTAAAARGGFTAVFAMANTDPVTDTAERVRDQLRRARGASAEVVPVGAITRGLAGGELSEIAEMHAEGVTYFSDDGRCVMDAGLMRQALRRIGVFGGVAAQHAQDHSLAGNQACFPDADYPCESTVDKLRQRNRPHGLVGHGELRHGDGSSVTGHGDGSSVTGSPDWDSPTCWPSVAESVIVARDAQLALDTGTHVHICHVSTAESVEVLRWAKSRRIPITAEVTPHHLLLGSDLLASRDTRYKVNPPLRTLEDREALWQALSDGTIDVVATDHAPHLPVDKDKHFPDAKPGMIGLEYALGVVIKTMVATNLLDWCGVADRMSYVPARVGQISTRQGRPLDIGETATLTLIDPTRHSVVNKNDSLSLGRNNPYDGLDLPDPVLLTLWSGRVTYHDPALFA